MKPKLPKPPEVRELSDKGKLRWQEFHRPLLAASAALNGAFKAAEDSMARQLIEVEGLDVKDWYLETGTCRLIRRTPE